MSSSLEPTPRPLRCAEFRLPSPTQICSFPPFFFFLSFFIPSYLLWVCSVSLIFFFSFVPWFCVLSYFPLLILHVRFLFFSLPFSSWVSSHVCHITYVTRSSHLTSFHATSITPFFYISLALFILLVLSYIGWLGSYYWIKSVAPTPKFLRVRNVTLRQKQP